MAIYWVELIRNKEEHTWVDVEADDEESAKKRAVEEADSAWLDWDEDFSDIFVNNVELKEDEKE